MAEVRDDMRPLEQRLAPRFTEGWSPWLPNEGWDGLLNLLVDEIEKIDPDFTLHQVKEKFGGLRFYAGFSANLSKEQYDKLGELVMQAEAKSYKICEWCGQAGELRDDIGWILTLCDEDYEKRKVERAERIAEYNKAVADDDDTPAVT